MIIRLVREPARQMLDGVVAGGREPPLARHYRAVGTRMAGIMLMVFGVRAVLSYSGSPQLALDTIDIIGFLIFCGALQRHAWATGYTTRHREIPPRPRNQRPAPTRIRITAEQRGPR